VPDRVSKIRATLFILFLFARPEVSRDRADRRFIGEFFVLCASSPMDTEDVR
jgi:hypothetical protein